MTEGTAPVAVVVVAWNAATYLPDCLASLQRLRRPPAEVVVFDNASSDGGPDLVRSRFPAVRLVEAGANLGYCRGNNMGIAATTSPFVLVLNPDTVLGEDFLEEVLPAFEDPAVGIATGKLLRFDGRTLDSAGQSLGWSRQPIDRGYGRPDLGQFDRDEDVFGACGAAALYRRSMLDAIALGPGVVFDESFFAFYEDLDLAWRARRAGWRAVYRHRAVGRHARGGTASSTGPRRFAAILGRPPEIRFHVVKNRWLTLIRNQGALDFPAVLPFVAARDAAVLALLLVSSPGVLVSLWRAKGLFRAAFAARRLDAAASRDEVGSGGAP